MPVSHFDDALLKEGVRSFARTTTECIHEQNAVIKDPAAVEWSDPKAAALSVRQNGILPRCATV